MIDSRISRRRDLLVIVTTTVAADRLERVPRNHRSETIHTEYRVTSTDLGFQAELERVDPPRRVDWDDDGRRRRAAWWSGELAKGGVLFATLDGDEVLGFAIRSEAKRA